MMKYTMMKYTLGDFYAAGLFFCLLVAIVSACAERPSGSLDNPIHYKASPERASDVYKDTYLSVYKYEGHEYLSNYNGGIIHSYSCPGNH